MTDLANCWKLPTKRVATARIDGFTERLNSIINGVFISELFSIKFYFSWNSTNKRVVGSDFHNVSITIPKIFNKSILEKHYIPFEKWHELNDDNKSPANCETISGENVVHVSHKLKIGNSIPCVSNFITIDYAETISKVLDPFYLKLQRDFKDLKDYTAIHYRGGDIIYGFFKGSEIAAQGTKSATLSEIEYIIKERPKDKFIIFGSASKETIKGLTYIKKKFFNSYLAVDLFRHSGHPVLVDCIAMSVCKAVIGQPTSGVVRLAMKLNYYLKVYSFESIIAEGKRYSLFLSGLSNPDYNYHQRIYHGIRALTTPEADEEFISKIINHLKAKQNNSN